MNILPLEGDTEKILEPFIYQALYVAEGEEPFPKEIVNEPHIRKYIKGIDLSREYGFLAWEDEQLAGAIWGRFLPESTPGYGYYLDSYPEITLAVLTEYQKKGIGTQLLACFIKEAEKRQLPGISLSVSYGNYAIKLYQSFGFEIIAERETDILMVKHLSGAKEFTVSCFPEKIADIARTTGIRQITEHHVSGDLVYALGDKYILKISGTAGRLLREKNVNDFLKGKVSVSETIEYAEENGVEFYLKTCVEGENLIKACLKDPEKLVGLLADAIRIYHAIDITDCTIKNPDSEGSCFVHGDFCLPNILVKDGKVSGFIDTEASGIGDPWVDYAWAIWSLEYNLKTKDYTPMLLEKLGISFDEEKFIKYTTA